MAAIQSISHTNDGIVIWPRSHLQSPEFQTPLLDLRNDKLHVDPRLTLRPEMPAFADKDLRQLPELSWMLPVPKEKERRVFGY